MKEIFERRSIRKYKPGKLDEQTIKQIVKAGMNAPSAVNQKSYEFVVITDEAVKEAVHQAHPYSSMIPDASLVIAVTARLNTQRAKDYFQQDCSAAMENMLLAATSLGLGSVWLGVCPRKDRMEAIGEILHVPEDVVVFGLGVFGEKAEHKEPNDFYDENKVFFNTYK